LRTPWPELKRAREIGLRTVCLGSFPNGSGTPAPDGRSLLGGRASTSNMPITAHSAMGDRSNPLLVQSARGTFDLEMSMLSRTMPPPAVGMVRMILSGVLDRFPRSTDLLLRRPTPAGYPACSTCSTTRTPSSSTGSAWTSRCGRASTSGAISTSGSCATRWPCACATCWTPITSCGARTFRTRSRRFPRVATVARRDLRRVSGRTPPTGPGRHPPVRSSVSIPVRT